MESNLREAAWAEGPLGTYREFSTSNESDFNFSVHLKKNRRSPDSVRGIDMY